MLKVNNWASYQSYKDRRPPWIRFHKTILDDYNFQRMSANARALVPMLWLLASEDKNPTSGLIDLSYEEIAFRLRLKESDIKSGVQEAIKSGFINELLNRNEAVTNPLREGNETVTTETETETEKRQRHNSISCPENVSNSTWQDFLTHRKAKRAPVTETVIAGISREATKAGISLQHALETIVERGWQGFKAEWLTKGKNNDPSQLRGHAAHAAIGAAARRILEHGEHDGRPVTEIANVEPIGLLSHYAKRD